MIITPIKQVSGQDECTLLLGQLSPGLVLNALHQVNYRLCCYYLVVDDLAEQNGMLEQIAETMKNTVLPSVS